MSYLNDTVIDFLTEKYSDTNLVHSNEFKSDINDIVESIINDRNLVLRKILNDLLSAISKINDAPCSAETHLDSAVVNLVSLLPNYETNNTEFKEIIKFAVDMDVLCKGLMK